MKTLKKVLVLCLLVVLSLTLLVACGEDNTKNDVKFTITYDLNIDDANAHFADTLDTSKTLSIEYLNSQRIEPPAKPSCKGYDFIGWYTTKEVQEGEKPFAFKYTGVGKDTTLYARWSKQSVYTAKFKLVDGTTNETLHDFEYVFTGNKGDKSDANKLADEVNAYITAQQEVDKTFAVKPSFVVVKEGLDHFEIDYNAVVKIDDTFAEYADENKTVTFVMTTVKIEELRYFQYGTNKVAYVVCREDADGNFRMDINSAFRKDETGKIIVLSDEDFEQDVNGKRLMPKIIDNNIEVYEGKKSVEKGKYFKYWQVDYSSTSNKPNAYYNELGNKLEKTKDGKYVEASPIVNIFSEDYRDIDKITCIPEIWQCKVRFMDNGKWITQDGVSQNIEDAYVATMNYGSYGVNALTTGLHLEAKPGKELSGWKYNDNYPDSRVSKNMDVDDTQVIKDREIVIYSVYKNKTKEVKFEIGDNEYFDTEMATGTVIPRTLDDVNKFIKEPTGSIAGKFRGIVGAYYVYPSIVTPTTIDRAKLDPNIAGREPVIRKALEQYERELTKQQKTLLGFSLKDSNELIIKVENGKFVLPNNQTELTFEDDFITLVPKFGWLVNGKAKIGKGRENAVTVDTIGLVQDKKGNIIEGVTITGFTNNCPAVMLTEAKQNTTNIGSYSAEIKGYKFTGKWLVKSTAFSNCTMDKEGFDGSIFNGVVFDSNYPVLGDVVIQPVFEVTNYQIKFVNNLDKKDIVETFFIGDLNSKLDKTDVTIAEATQRVIDKYKANLPKTDKMDYYQFDDWYATIIDENGVSIRKSLTMFDGNFNQNVTFTPSFIYKPYNIQYKYVDVDLLLANRDKIKTYNDMVKFVSADGKGLFIDGLKQLNAFDKNGIKGKYTDKNENVYDYTDVLDLSKLTDKVDPGTFAKGQATYNAFLYDDVNKYNYIIGWQYHDLSDPKNPKWTRFTKDAKIAFDTADIVDNTVTVYPLFQEFDISLDFNGSGAILKHNDKLLNSLTVKGGYFGVDLSFINQNNLTRGGYMFTGSWLAKDENKKDVVYNNEKITSNLTLRAKWDTIDHLITVTYTDTDNSKKVIYYGGNIECIFEIDQGEAALGNIIPTNYDKKLHIQDLIVNAKELPHIEGSKNPEDLYAVDVYLLDDKTGIYNTISTLDYSTKALTIEVTVTYKKLSLSLNANGGKHRGNITDGHDVLEQFVDEKKVLTTTTNGIGSAYVSKNAEIGGFDFVDQGIPVKAGYVFAGYVVGKDVATEIVNLSKADFINRIKTTKFYYGYEDASDVFAGGDTDIRNAIKTNGIWIGDSNFRTKATDLFKDEVDSNGKLVKIFIEELFAVWIPVKAQIIYCDEDGTRFGGKDADAATNLASIKKLVEDLGNGAIKSNFKTLLNPGEVILNPYHFNDSADDDKLVNWSISKGYKDTIEGGVIASESAKFTYDIALMQLNNDSSAMYYVSEFEVYRIISQAKTIVTVNYLDNSGVIQKTDSDIELNDYDRNHFNNTFATRTADSKFYVDTNYITLGTGENLGYILRKTYYVIEQSNPAENDYRFIDQLQYGTQFEISAFLNGVNGTLVKKGMDYAYSKVLNVKPGIERIPIEVIVHYMINNVENRVTHNVYGKPLVNPYYNDVFISEQDHKLLTEQEKKDFAKSNMAIANKKYVVDSKGNGTYEDINNMYLATMFRAYKPSAGAGYQIQRLSWFGVQNWDDVQGKYNYTQEFVKDFYTNTNKILSDKNDANSVAVTLYDFPKIVDGKLPVVEQVENGKAIFNANIYGTWVDIKNAEVKINSTYLYKENEKDTEYIQYGDVLSTFATAGATISANIANPTLNVNDTKKPGPTYPELTEPLRRTWKYNGMYVDKINPDNTKAVMLSLPVETITDGGILPHDVIKSGNKYTIVYNIKLYDEWVVDYRTV